jgi:hypothetical protein
MNSYGDTIKNPRHKSWFTFFLRRCQALLRNALTADTSRENEAGAWVKFRMYKGQDPVIGGYRIGKTYFDNLAVGYYDDAGLIFIAKIKNRFASSHITVNYIEPGPDENRFGDTLARAGA